MARTRSDGRTAFRARTVARKLGDGAARLEAVCPGRVETPMTAAAAKIPGLPVTIRAGYPLSGAAGFVTGSANGGLSQH